MCRSAVGSVVSNAMHLQCGVPQSSVLGPRLYCNFANPISEICRRHNFSHHSYADDTQVYRVNKPLDNWKNISTYGDRRFDKTASTLWNNLHSETPK
jgi:hypothetical protein